MSNNTQKHIQSGSMTLHGQNACGSLESLNDKLRRAVAMADVLNTAAFARDVELQPESLQDFTTDLSALLHEVRDITSQWQVAKEAA